MAALPNSFKNTAATVGTSTTASIDAVTSTDAGVNATAAPAIPFISRAEALLILTNTPLEPAVKTFAEFFNQRDEIFADTIRLNPFATELTSEEICEISIQRFCRSNDCSTVAISSPSSYIAYEGVTLIHIAELIQFSPRYADQFLCGWNLVIAPYDITKGQNELASDSKNYNRFVNKFFENYEHVIAHENFRTLCTDTSIPAIIAARARFKGSLAHIHRCISAVLKTPSSPAAELLAAIEKIEKEAKEAAEKVKAKTEANEPSVQPQPPVTFLYNTTINATTNAIASATAASIVSVASTATTSTAILEPMSTLAVEDPSTLTVEDPSTLVEELMSTSFQPPK